MKEIYIEMTQTQVDTLIRNLLDQLEDKTSTVKYQSERIEELEKKLANLIAAQVQAKEEDF